LLSILFFLWRRLIQMLCNKHYMSDANVTLSDSGDCPHLSSTMLRQYGVAALREYVAHHGRALTSGLQLARLVIGNPAKDVPRCPMCRSPTRYRLLLPLALTQRAQRYHTCTMCLRSTRPCTTNCTLK
jgi:hypothetical protein